MDWETSTARKLTVELKVLRISTFPILKSMFIEREESFGFFNSKLVNDKSIIEGNFLQSVIPPGCPSVSFFHESLQQQSVFVRFQRSKLVHVSDSGSSSASCFLSSAIPVLLLGLPSRRPSCLPWLPTLLVPSTALFGRSGQQLPTSKVRSLSKKLVRAQKATRKENFRKASETTERRLEEREGEDKCHKVRRGEKKRMRRYQ
jgi:hypothetical protein